MVEVLARLGVSIARPESFFDLALLSPFARSGSAIDGLSPYLFSVGFRLSIGFVFTEVTTFRSFTESSAEQVRAGAVRPSQMRFEPLLRLTVFNAVFWRLGL